MQVTDVITKRIDNGVYRAEVYENGSWDVYSAMHDEPFLHGYGEAEAVVFQEIFCEIARQIKP